MHVSDLIGDFTTEDILPGLYQSAREWLDVLGPLWAVLVGIILGAIFLATIIDVMQNATAVRGRREYDDE